MQLDVLRGLLGPEVEPITAENSFKVSPESEEVLLLDVDGAEHTLALAGRSGSFSKVLSAIAKERGLEACDVEWYLVDWDNGRRVLSRVYLRVEDE
jgi:hypothetical protein